MREFYTKEQVAEYLVSLLALSYKKIMTNLMLDTALRTDGFYYKSFSNNSIDCHYYGKRIRVQVTHSKTKGTIPVDITYYPK